MATWKKLVVSGSAISQLTNDAGYISASQVPSGYNAYSTASVNGVSLIAAASGTLTFATGSATGLTISGSAATDVITFSLSDIPTQSLQFSGSTIGSTFVGLGSTVTTLAGLTSVTATNFTGTASYATLATTALSANSATSASYSTVASSSLFATNASSSLHAVSASQAANAGQLQGLAATAFVLNSQTSSMSVATASQATSASFATLAASATSASFATTASFAINAPNATNANTASNITPAITNELNNRVLTANGGGTINGEANLTFDGTTLNLNGSQIISGDLTVNGTTTTINTANLNVADKFILLSSGSTSANDGGIIIQSNVNGTGFAFLYDQGQARWAYTGSLSSTASTATPDAFAAVVLDLANGSTDVATYQKNGNIKIDGADIYIYS